MASFFFIVRSAFAWILLLVFWLILWTKLIRGPSWIFLLASMFVTIWVLVRSVSHVRRVHLVAGRVDAEALGNRHRRQVEMPFPPDEAFTIVEAAIRELPNVENVDTARDSLQAARRS